MLYSAKAFLITAVIFLIDHMDAFRLPPSNLIPSQVRRPQQEARNRNHPSQQDPLPKSTVQCLLVPSRVITSRNQAYSKLQATSSGSLPGNATEVSSVAGAAIKVTAMPAASNKTARHRRKRGRRKGQPNENPTNATTSSIDQNGNATKLTPARIAARKRRTFPTAGNLPDIHWRAVTLENLRQHPLFEPLPLPQSIEKLDCLEDVRNFRQESWQWDALHNGRCTTSQAVAALGFLDPAAGGALGVPWSWRKGSIGAFYRLRADALGTIEEMNKVLCETEEGGEVMRDSPERQSSSSSSSASSLWEDPADGSPFAAKYLVETSAEEARDRKILARRYATSGHLAKSIRMMWGNTQESTALLTALNYFSQDEPDIRIREVGMCGAGLDVNTTDVRSSLLVGATPDALLVHPDGRIEALEVKNHCPFATTNWKTQLKQKSKGGGNKTFHVRDYPFDVEKAGVFSHYIPQLMMEMLCVGPECRSAVMVRQTATQGALILRMHRDDEWIEEMLYWLHRFQHDYVEKDVPPPVDIFWSAEKEDSDRYKKFIKRTLKIRDAVEVVSHIPSDMIQRIEEDAPFFLD
jgi:hypothetical protein